MWQVSRWLDEVLTLWIWASSFGIKSIYISTTQVNKRPTMTPHILTCWLRKHRAIVQIINRIIRSFTRHLQRTSLILIHLPIRLPHYLLIIVYFALQVFFNWLYTCWRYNGIRSILECFSWALSERYFAVVLLLFR